MAAGWVDYKVTTRGYIICYPLLHIFNKQADNRVVVFFLTSFDCMQAA